MASTTKRSLPTDLLEQADWITSRLAHKWRPGDTHFLEDMLQLGRLAALSAPLEDGLEPGQTLVRLRARIYSRLRKRENRQISSLALRTARKLKLRVELHPLQPVLGRENGEETARVDDQDELEHVLAFVTRRRNRLGRVLSLLWGADRDWKPRNMAEVGRVLGVCRERARQLTKQAYKVALGARK